MKRVTEDPELLAQIAATLCVAHPGATLAEAIEEAIDLIDKAEEACCSIKDARKYGPQDPHSISPDQSTGNAAQPVESIQSATLASISP